MQIEKCFKQMGTGFKITCCYGGHKREIEENNLIQPPGRDRGYTRPAGRPHPQGQYQKPVISVPLVLDEFDNRWNWALPARFRKL